MACFAHIFNEFLKSQILHGQYETIAVEARGNGLGGLVFRTELHASEVIREERMKAFHSGPQKYMVVAINPLAGRFGLYQVFKRDGELDFEQENPNLADPDAGTRESVRLKAEGLVKTIKVCEKVARQLTQKEIFDFESLLAAIPADVDVADVLAQLKDANGRRLNYETPAGSFSTGGFDQLPTSVPCSQEYVVVAEILKTDKNKSGNGCVTVKIVEAPKTSNGIPAILVKGAELQAEMATANKRNSLRLCHFSAYQEKLIHMSLQLNYVFSKKRWDVKVTDILFKTEMLESAVPIQEVFSNW